LMAALGLLLGWKNILLVMVLGCFLGAVIHLVLMAVFKKGRQLAFGPYLSAGAVITMICGRQILEWYIGILTASMK
ncbi:MAG: prepilin peptidase, partial [Lachnospiraceae bacterium]|nr:prepilin peptidase [Lachnospiraceae bacterium]